MKDPLIIWLQPHLSCVITSSTQQAYKKQLQVFQSPIQCLATRLCSLPSWFPLYMWQNSTQPSWISSSLFLVKFSLTLTYFSPAKMIIYPFSSFFIPKVISAYHNIWLVICLLWPTLSISEGIVSLIPCLPSTQHSAYHSQHPINICWAVK